MKTDKMQQTWPIWINEDKRFITINKSPGSRQIFFKNRETDIKRVCELVSKGYKIG